MTRVTLLIGLISSKLSFFHKNAYSVVGRFVMYCLFVNLVGSTSLLDMIKSTKSAVSFHCDVKLFDILPPSNCCDVVKMVIQKAGKDPEQNLEGSFAKLRLMLEIYKKCQS